MSLRRNLTLSLVAGGLAAGGYAAAQGLAQATQSPVVVTRFLLGYFDGQSRFVPTAGRGATNVDRNALVMFLFSGPVDTGPNTRVTLPLTIAEQAELDAAQAADPDFDPAQNGYEPGVTPRKKSSDRAAYFVATGSVDQTSVSIAAPQPGGTATQAPGQFFKVLKGRKDLKPIDNRLLFNPRYSVSTFGTPHQVDYNPAGLEAATQYEVFIDGGGNPQHPFELLRNLDGAGLAVPFTTVFTTTNRYVQDFTRPQIRSTSPTDGTSNVVSDADIEITFSEAMNVASFQAPKFQGDTSWTVTSRYTLNPINGLFQGRDLLIQVRVKPQTGGNVIQIRPIQGFGKGPSEIECIVRTGVTDLSGNNIIRQIQFTFKTVFNPNADQAGFAEEKFDNTTKRDPAFGIGQVDAPAGDNVVATWNAASAPGFLKGVIADTIFDVIGPTSNNSVNLFGVAGLQFQNLYTVKDMGNRPRTITSAFWRANTFSGQTYPNMSMQMGHANDIVAAAGFPGSAGPSPTLPGPSPTYYRDTPTLVIPSNTYSTAGKLSGAFVAMPKFSQNFNFDGQNPVILEIAHGGNGIINERWQADVNFAIQANIYSNFSSNPPNNGSNRWYFETRFTYVTPGAEAQSLWYDIGRDDARMLPQQIVPNTQPQGTSVTFVWQGAKADAATPTKPDLATLTPWVPDVRQLSNYRHIRFRATLVNNTILKTAPQIDSILIPFAYK
jgi:hypothetical protein